MCSPAAAVAASHKTITTSPPSSVNDDDDHNNVWLYSATAAGLAVGCYPIVLTYPQYAMTLGAIVGGSLALTVAHGQFFGEKNEYGRELVSAAHHDEQDNHKMDDNLWYIHGQAYDLTDFVARHPGGEDAIRLVQGRDGTALVRSYHPFAQKAVQQVLNKYRVETPSSQQSVVKMTATAPSKEASLAQQQGGGGDDDDDKFYRVICDRVQTELQRQGFDVKADRGANLERYSYYIAMILAGIVLGYGHVNAQWWGSFGLALVGFWMGAAGHDAGHFAASRSPRVNSVLAWSFCLLCNPTLWLHQHTYAHHSFTNEFDHDPDLHHFDYLIRVHRRFKHNNIYRHQRSMPLILLAYALVVFGECIWIPLGLLRDGTLYGLVEISEAKQGTGSWSRCLGMYLHLIGYTALILVAPFLTASSAWTALACVLIHIATAGWMFGFFSQINHLNEASIELDRDENDDMKPLHPDAVNSWAARQVETSNNFCPGSTLWYYLSIGLNLQIEHHLFPGLNHCHLWRIRHIVEDTCTEYGVRYKMYDTWGELWAATRDWLDKLADDDESLQSKLKRAETESTTSLQSLVSESS